MNITTISDDLKTDIVHSIIGINSRDVILNFTSIRAVCPVCGGNNPFCGTCNGNGTVDTQVTSTLKGTVKWTSSDDKIYTSLGQAPEGDCVVILPWSPSGGAPLLLEQITSVIVDNKTCVVSYWRFRGNPVNRVYVVLKEDSNGTQRIG